MSRALFISCILFSLFGCDDCDYSLNTQARNILNTYQDNDTLFYRSINSDDIDTMVIVSRDSIQTCGALMAGKRNEHWIRCRHLPVNHWTGGMESNGNGKSKVLFQRLISLVVDMETNEYWYGIDYRDFIGELHDSLLIEDSYLAEIGVNEYWKMDNEYLQSKNATSDSSIIISLIWTEKFGITEYVKLNGDTLRVY